MVFNLCFRILGDYDDILVEIVWDNDYGVILKEHNTNYNDLICKLESDGSISGSLIDQCDEDAL